MATQEVNLKRLLKRNDSSILDSLGGLEAPRGSGESEEPEAPRLPTHTYHGKLATGATSPIQDRALKLLGAGIGTESVASALGVSPGRISQLLAEEEFSNKVADIRYQNMQKHNLRDSKYDDIEDKLLVKLESSIPLMFKPQDILKAVATINSAKRRGQASPDQIVSQQNIVNLVLPEIIAQKFTVNINNQVTRAGEQELHTMDASSLLKKIEKEEELKQGKEQEILLQTPALTEGDK